MDGVYESRIRINQIPHEMKYFQFIRAMELFHEIMLMRLRLLGSRVHIGWLYVQLGWIQVQNFVLTGRFIDMKKLRESREED